MNIAICDDDRLMTGQIEKLVEQVFHGETSKYNTEVFFSGDRLLDFLAQSPNYLRKASQTRSAFAYCRYASSA